MANRGEKIAKIIFPLMSMEAHGLIGQGIVFATGAWGQSVYFNPPRKPTSTVAQRKVRHVYGQIASMWRELTAEQKKAYHAEAIKNRHTDYNEFYHQKWPEVYEP